MTLICHCEEHGDEAIPERPRGLSVRDPDDERRNVALREPLRSRAPRRVRRSRGFRTCCASCSRTCCGSARSAAGAPGTSRRSWHGLARHERRRACPVRPARVMMDDTAGLPLIGDLAAMRDAAMRLGASGVVHRAGDPCRFHRRSLRHRRPHRRAPMPLALNMALEMERNAERYRFLRWAGQAFRQPAHSSAGPRHLPPDQPRVSRAGRARRRRRAASRIPDTMVGIDSHTPMANSLGVVAWGVSGIEGLSAALGEPVAMPHSGSRRLPPDRTPARRCHRDRSRAHDDAAAARARCRRQGRRILRPGPRRAHAAGPRHGREHDARGRRDDELLSRSIAKRCAISKRPGEIAQRSRARRGVCEERRACGTTPAARLPQYSATLEIDLACDRAVGIGSALPHSRMPLSKAPPAFGRCRRRQRKRARRKRDPAISRTATSSSPRSRAAPTRRIPR